MADYAGQSNVALQHCTRCGTIQYPPRELCVACLADQLEWRVAPSETGELLANTLLHHSHVEEFRSALPLHVGLVRLDAGPSVICFLATGCHAGRRVRVTAHNDADGRPVLSAAPV
jgi:uncharacterized OB-fold protein